MKIWFNKVHDSRRHLLEVEGDEVTIGRDGKNRLVLRSPLVSKQQAVVRRINGQLELENVGINSCMIGEREVMGGETTTFSPGETVRIWPFTVTFESDEAAPISRQDLEAHLRTLMSGLEMRRVPRLSSVSYGRAAGCRGKCVAGAGRPTGGSRGGVG